MCTATFWPTSDGYRVAMNRDEQRRRPPALPPAIHRSPLGTALHPLETDGGTWISVNDAGITLFLVNWYTVPSKATPGAVTRGAIIQALCQARSLDTAEPNPAPSTRPFRLIGVFPGSRRVREWRWDSQSLSAMDHPWEPRQWISSGLDEPGAQRIRAGTFTERCGAPDAGSASWLRALHASHDPEPGPYSHCVHRQDAATVSSTQIEVLPTSVTLSYHPGSPCIPTDGHQHTLTRTFQTGLSP
jgi:hypothetical protein